MSDFFSNVLHGLLYIFECTMNTFFSDSANPVPIMATTGKQMTKEDTVVGFVVGITVIIIVCGVLWLIRKKSKK